MNLCINSFSLQIRQDYNPSIFFYIKKVKGGGAFLNHMVIRCTKPDIKQNIKVLWI